MQFNQINRIILQHNENYFQVPSQGHNKLEKGMEGRGHMLSLLGSNSLYLAIVVTTTAAM